MTILYNRRELLTLRRKLRRRETPAEKATWRELRKRRLDGIKFFRQYSVDRYILDFYSPTYRLAVEIDGPYHLDEEQQKRDAKRTAELESLGIRVIRFTNDEVLSTIQSVLARIREAVEARRREDTPP